ncbi:MAG: dUTP diphosphatase [Promethearchaeota archaeon]
MTLKVRIKKWRDDSILPKFPENGDAGADCFINGFKKIINSSKKKLEEIDSEKYDLQPLERVLCPLGFASEIPQGYYGAVVPRSGLALWEGISIVNSPGTIDAGYRNEWGAIVVNLSNKPITLHKGDKICQFIIRKMVDYELETVETLSESHRGLGGFGSTGKK